MVDIYNNSEETPPPFEQVWDDEDEQYGCGITEDEEDYWT